AEAGEEALVIARARESAAQVIRAVRTTAVAWTVAGSGIQLAVIAILGVGAMRVDAGTLAVSTLVAFLLYAFTIIDPITTLTQTFTELQSGIAAARRIRETEDVRLEDVHRGRDVEPAIVPAADRAGTARPGPGSADDAVLRLRGVGLTYPGATEPAVHDLDLAVRRYGHTALVGPSGAGKTSTLSLVRRFLQPERGSLELDGAPYHELSIDAVRRRIGYVEQETPVLAGTVRENVVLRHPDAGDDEVWAALEAVRLDTTVRRLPDGLDAEVSGTTLSGGE
ncbi:MAG TPA: ABC transporter ATP-binding protein, partial [Actinotalea sp.]|nr:ABC transporter ATP-binding protein [Actinotalea sp.]